jgi:hypothetical protein
MFAANDGENPVAQLTVASEISLGGCLGITSMIPGISMSYDTSTGTTTCSVDTTNTLGYKVDIFASTSPALKNGANYFNDLSTTSVPTTWADATTTNWFGYSLVGADVSTAKWGAPTTPNICSQPGPANLVKNNLNFMGFGTLSTTTITRNIQTGGPSTFYICLAAEQGASTNTPSGIYFATTTVTATTL